MINQSDFKLIRFHTHMQDELGNFVEMGYLYYHEWLDMFQEFDVTNNEYELSSITYQNEPQLAIL